MLEVVRAKREERDTMMNLLERYQYEFSQWEKTDVVLCQDLVQNKMRGSAS